MKKKRAPVRRKPPAKQAVRFIKCRKCKWATAISADKLGKGGSGWRKINEHMQEHHPGFFAKVKRWAKP